MEFTTIFRIGVIFRFDISIYKPAGLVLVYPCFVLWFGVDILEECIPFKGISRSIKNALRIALLWHARWLDPGLGEAPNRQFGHNLVDDRDWLHSDRLKTDLNSISAKRPYKESAGLFE